MSVKSILIVGVGGQGTLLASKLLGGALVAEGRDVKVSEVHGMSQRGGSVITYVRYGEVGEQVSSPIIDAGEADVILSFELLESARYLPYLKPDGAIITNTQRIDPMPVITGTAQYPEDIEAQLTAKNVRLTAIDALSLAEQAGSSKAVNVVLLGVLSRHLDIAEDVWQEIIRTSVAEKFRDINIAAFELGRKAVQ